MTWDGVRALVFDLDDTLVVERASAEAAFLETCALARRRYGLDPGALHATVRRTCRDIWHEAPVRDYCVEIGISSWEALWARFEGDDANLRTLRAWTPSYRSRSWREALQQHGIDDDTLASELADRFGVNRRKRHIVYEDVRPALQQLRESFRLALLTNGAPDLQREKIAGAGIASYFDHIVISGDVGFGKPDRRIYEVMLARLAEAAGAVVMIGNSLATDVRGARAVGMRTVWLNRNGEQPDEMIVPDREVTNLAELQRILCRDNAG